MVRLVDDQEVSRRLRSSGPSDDKVYTTGLWYLRLCQAALNPLAGRGVLSAPFAQLESAQRQRALQAVLELPDHVELISLRHLAPHMAQLRTRFQLNLLATEALAAAMRLGAQVTLSAPSPRLEAALGTVGCDVHRLY